MEYERGEILKNSTYSITFPSVTFALMAHKLLYANGYDCKIDKNCAKNAGGCTHCVDVSGNITEITMLLEKNGIKVRSVSDRGGGI